MTKPSYRDLVLMIDVMCAAIELRLLPAIGSPCHRQARDFVAASGCKPRRNRLRLPRVKP